MSEIVLLGPDDHGLIEGFESRGLTVGHLEGAPIKADLEAGGVADAAVYLLTDIDRAATIPVAHEVNPDLFIVVYSTDSLPAFATRQADLAIDPRLVAPEEVVGAVVDRVAIE